MSKIRAIVAVDSDWGIGKNNDMPWPRLNSDLQRFKELTENSVVLMGKNTWLSLPKKPLPNRENVVVTSSLKDDFVIKTSSDPETIINKIQSATEKPIWIIGGRQIYEQFLPYCDSVYLTKINGDFQCDVHFPSDTLHTHFVLESKNDPIIDNNTMIHYEIWRKNNAFN
jgi:dihydrofolate reductase